MRLPVIYCPTCRHQLVNFIYTVVTTDELICLFCAKERPAGTVAPIAEGGFCDAELPALDPVDAIALLVRHGATLEET